MHSIDSIKNFTSIKLTGRMHSKFSGAYAPDGMPPGKVILLFFEFHDCASHSS